MDAVKATVWLENKKIKMTIMAFLGTHISTLLSQMALVGMQTIYWLWRMLNGWNWLVCSNENTHEMAPFPLRKLMSWIVCRKLLHVCDVAAVTWGTYQIKTPQMHLKYFGNLPFDCDWYRKAGSWSNNSACAFHIAQWGRGRGHELRPEQTHWGTVTSIVSLIDASGSGKYCFCEAILV